MAEANGSAPRGGGLLLGHRHVQGFSDPERRWLEAELGPGGVCLAWLEVASAQPPAGLDSPSGKVAWRLLLTPYRLALVAFPRAPKGAALAPVAFELTAPGPMVVREGLGRRPVTVAGWTYRSALTNGELHAELSAAAALSGAARIREVGRLGWTRRGRRREGMNETLALLAEARRRGGVEEALSHEYMLRASRGRPEEAFASPDAAVEALADRLLDAVPGGALARWATDFRLPPTARHDLARALLGRRPYDRGAAETALPLHRAAHEARRTLTRDLGRLALLDLELAEHLLLAGEREDARLLLERRLEALPDEALLDLLPPAGVDLTVEGPQAVRIRCLELLVEARGEPGESDRAAVAELARLQPLVVDRVGELASLAEGELRRRAEVVHRLLGPDGLAARAEPEARTTVHPLPGALVEQRLAYRRAEVRRALESLQSWLGEAKVPDYRAIRAYAERATERSQPLLVGVLADAALALGVPSVEIFVSRGDKSLGVRAYDGSPPFVVVGGDHLDEGSEVYLREPALRFVLGAEVAHLRFHHARLTSTDVWDGAFQKGTKLLQLVGTFAGPLGLIGGAVGGLGRLAAARAVLRGAQAVAAGAGKAAGAVGGARGVSRAASRLRSRTPAPRHDEIGERESGLLTACRLMQVTADRAGLVLSGDLTAAVEGVFLTSAEQRAELAVARRHGLDRALARRDGDGELVNAGLAVRLAALLSFYLSEGYPLLRDALEGRDASADGRP